MVSKLVALPTPTRKGLPGAQELNLLEAYSSRRTEGVFRHASQPPQPLPVNDTLASPARETGWLPLLRARSASLACEMALTPRGSLRAAFLFSAGHLLYFLPFQ